MNDLFANKAADWDTRPFPLQLSAGIGAALLARVPLRPDQTALDFGAGTGLITAKIADKVQAVIAVDVSPAMLTQLAAKPELAGKVTTVCQNLLEQPLGQQVDLIVSAMAMHHVQDTAALLRTLYAHLRPGGTVALADLDSEDGSFHPPGTEGVFHHGFDRETFARDLQAVGFVKVDVQTACSVDKDGQRYSVFLATAGKG
jgi:2-polyprenyl-3-methyl-5-hydroxy-6-metoxy-1,4-benzoquinol methylase